MLLAMADYHTEAESDLKPAFQRGDLRIVSQNVRGFAAATRWEWLSAWRNIPQASRPAMILLQETHVSTEEERDELAQRWNWMWGKPVLESPLSYWSVDSSKTGGVGILIYPDFGGDVQPWNHHLWTKRSIGVKFQDMNILNVYAPASDKISRENFFTGLHKWDLQQTSEPVLAGDFNCVETPLLDRLGGIRPERTESEALSQLVLQLQLVDARVQVGTALEELELAPHEHFTYWKNDVASRIDRFYIPTVKTKWLQWLQVQLPPVPSDHDEVTLHLRDPSASSQRRAARRVIYPIKGAHTAQLLETMLKELNGKGPTHGPGHLSWDAWIKQCRDSIKRWTSREKRKRKRKASKLQQSLRENLTSRSQLLQGLVAEIREQNASRLGNRLKRTPTDTRWLFRKTAIWERDQTVTQIQAPPGQRFKPALSIPERFASVWSSIMGKRHSKLHPEQMTEAVSKFVYIPPERKVNQHDNKRLLAPIDEDDLLAAIALLQRHKAGGEDGLNNDFYKDLAGAMVPKLVEVCNELLSGQPPPESFLKAVVVPLRKKGDSPNALDYRPISLLQTSYKLFAKILATRLQKFLGRLIGNTQQGFVHGRQMDRSVIMMMAQLETAIDEEKTKDVDSAGILLLDFAKAYDTVDRIYLLEVLRQFGFAPEFVDLMERLHKGTTAQFLVNGELSSPMAVNSGIRQGCPLAPLLFILAAEVLALAIQQDCCIQGQDIHGQECQEHKFSAFVDDSTVFLKKSGQLPRVLAIVKQFGEISGLHIQPLKSSYIFLNKAVSRETWHGIPVLQPGATVRYLGHDVGFSDLTKVNWAKRIRSLQRRLSTAENVATTVRDRVDLINAIFLPAILFTAKVFPPTATVLTQLVNMQKQFLWNKQLKDEPSRHKLTPGLIFTPREAGGLGLISIPVAIQAQRVKVAMLWLISTDDIYKAAWKAWMGIYGNEPAITPRSGTKQSCPALWTNRRKQLQQDMGPLLAPHKEEQSHRAAEVRKHLPRLAAQLGQGKRSATYKPRSRETIRITVDLPTYQPLEEIPPVLQAFWGTFTWAENPWIPDSTAATLLRSKYDRIEVTSLERLEIHCTAPKTYSAQVPTAPGFQEGHTIAKLERWLLAILLSSPRLCPGQKLGSPPPLTLRKPPKLKASYKWKLVQGPRTFTIGSTRDGSKQILLGQGANGLDWEVVSHHNATKDAKRLRKHGRKVVFQANPLLHGFPWDVADKTKNKNILKELKRQPRSRLRKEAGPALDKVITKWTSRGAADEWIRGQQTQEPRQLWAHRDTLTDYQVWVVFRMATQQLNLHFAGDMHRGCPMDTSCNVSKVTITHIMWDCKRAKQFWRRCLEHWLGFEVSDQRLEAFKSYFAARETPEIGTRMKQRIVNRYGQWRPENAEMVQRIWWALCSIGFTLLWQLRNQVVHKGEKWRARQQLEYMWSTCLRQLQAVARRDRFLAETRVAGLQFQLTLECFVDMTPDQDPLDPAPPPAKWLRKTKHRLINRLKLYQEAINKG